MESQQTFPASFGELLKTSRKRKRLTQKQLAQRLSLTLYNFQSVTCSLDQSGQVRACH